MKIKLSELKRMIREEFKSILAHDHPEDVDPVDGHWGVGSKQLESPVDHLKAQGIKERRRRYRSARKMSITELKAMIVNAATHKQRQPPRRSWRRR